MDGGRKSGNIEDNVIMEWHTNNSGADFTAIYQGFSSWQLGFCSNTFIWNESCTQLTFEFSEAKKT